MIKAPSRGGASLINDRWAVTAAHVVDGVPETTLELFGGLIDGRAATSRSVLTSEKIIIHPRYQRNVLDRTDFDHDIALIRLASRVTLGPNLLPICLPERNMVLEEGEQGTVSGWGVTERGVTPKLKYTTIGVYAQSFCRDTPSRPSGQRMTYTDNMFCAGAPDRDSCEKDSGGPFVLPMLTVDGGPYRLAGIVSWGSPCRERRFKGYYTKVKNYVSWMKETMDRTEKSLLSET